MCGSGFGYLGIKRIRHISKVFPWFSGVVWVIYSRVDSWCSPPLLPNFASAWTQPIPLAFQRFGRSRFRYCPLSTRWWFSGLCAALPYKVSRLMQSLSRTLQIGLLLQNRAKFPFSISTLTSGAVWAKTHRNANLSPLIFMVSWYTNYRVFLP